MNFKSTKMFSIFDFLFSTLASAIFIEAKYIVIPNDSGRVTNNYPQQVTPMMPGNAFYSQMTPQPTLQRSQPVPQFISDPSNINGVNTHIFPQQMPPMAPMVPMASMPTMMQANAFNPYMASQQEVQRSQHLSPLMLDPMTQGYQNQMPMSMPMQIPMPVDSFSQQIAFLIQSAVLRLRTLLAFAQRFVPNFSYSGPFMSNMSQSGYYPQSYTQQSQSKTESQEILGNEILEQQLKNAQEQQQVLENEHRVRDEYQDELEDKQILQLEEEEIEKEKKEAEERIKQEEQEEKERQDREKKLREDQELMLKQIEEKSKKKSSLLNGDGIRKTIQKNRLQKPIVKSSPSTKPSETQTTNPIQRQDPEISNDNQIKVILPKKISKPSVTFKSGKR